MREIIHLQIGQAGNQAGNEFWKEILKEHHIGYDGQAQKNSHLDNISVYFDQTKNNKYVPRSVLIDLEEAAIERIQSGRLGKLYRPDSIITGTGGAGNNWAKGFYTIGEEIVESILDVIHKQAEASDSLQGFQFLHSIGGGTGSGLGTLLLSKLKEDYSDRMFSTFCIYPSRTSSDVVVSPYNAVLTTHQLVEYSDHVMCLDNDALTNIAKNTLKIKNPDFQVLNSIIAKVMTGVTAPLRFPGNLNSDLRKLSTNLVPFPRLHFYMVGYAPIALESKYSTPTIRQLTQGLLQQECMMSNADPNSGVYLAASLSFRGSKISGSEVDSATLAIQQKNPERFVQWIPNNIKASISESSELPLTNTIIGNSTAIKSIFRPTMDKFSAMFQKKAFFHWFTDEGCDELEFSEAEANLQDLLAEYAEHEKIAYDDDVSDGSESDQD